MKKLLIGCSPLTTISGYILAILTGVHQAGATGSNWQDYLLPAALALFGRLAGDDRSTPPSAQVPSPVPNYPETQTEDEGTSFFRRGKRQRQKRSRNGQFAPAIS